MFCYKCGQELKDNAKFCPKCGLKIVDEELVSLVEKMQAGNAEAFDAFYNKTLNEVKSIVWSVSKGDSQETEDIIQEIYLIVYQKIGTLNNPSGVKAWLRTTSRNVAVSYMQKKGKIEEKQVPIVTSDEDGEKDLDIEDTLLLPEDVLINKERQKAVHDMLVELPEMQYRVLQEYYFAERTIAEIADQLNVQIGTIKSYLSKARDKMRQKVTDYQKATGVTLRSFAAATVLYAIFKAYAKEAVIEVAAAGAMEEVEQKLVGTAAQKGKKQAVKGLAKKWATKTAVKTAAIVATVSTATVGTVTYIAQDSRGAKEIDLNNYLSVTFSGYDTIGQADVEFDYNALREDYSDKLSYEETSEEGNNRVSPCEAIYNYVSGELDKNTALTNGEEIHFYWDDLEYVELPELNYEIKAETFTITVEGLTELREVDLFEDVEILYSGYAPFADAKVINNSKDEIISNFSYKLSKENDLDNGDTITIALRYYNDSDEEVAKQLAETYGIKAKELSKKMVVENCSEYARRLDDIPEELMQQFKAETEKAIYELPDWNWEKEVTIENVTHLGTYMIWNGEWPNENWFYLIYKVSIRENFPDKGIDNYFDAYYLSKCEDVVLLADGTFSSGNTQFGDNWNGFIREITDGPTLRYRYLYETYQDLYDDVLAYNVTNYTYYTDVNIEE